MDKTACLASLRIESWMCKLSPLDRYHQFWCILGESLMVFLPQITAIFSPFASNLKTSALKVEFDLDRCFKCCQSFAMMEQGIFSQELWTFSVLTHSEFVLKNNLCCGGEDKTRYLNKNVAVTSDTSDKTVQRHSLESQRNQSYVRKQLLRCQRDHDYSLHWCLI